MSKYAESDISPPFEKTDDKAAQLKFLERQFSWKGEDWHFRLLERLEPHQVHGFFCHAKLKDQTLWFDGSSNKGKFAYDWVKAHFTDELSGIFGNIRVALASRGAVAKYYWTKKDPQARRLTPEELAQLRPIA